jgi:hypothetical protein
MRIEGDRRRGIAAGSLGEDGSVSNRNQGNRGFIAQGAIVSHYSGFSV